MSSPGLGPQIRQLWCLDPSVAYLNHGSFGACPQAVLNKQSALRQEMEREPHGFLAIDLGSRLDAARETLGKFIGADPMNLVFRSNATSGVNAVLRSRTFNAGDEILATNVTYCRKAIDFVAERTKARVVVAQIPFPLGTSDEILESVLRSASPRTRLAVLDHITSPTGLILPIRDLVRELQSKGIDVLVDGSHAPGMVPLALQELGAAYYVGNAHKWLCAPKGAAFLHVRTDRIAGLHPSVISHGLGEGLHAEFDWTGSFDPTAWLCIPEVIEFMGGLLPGGWAEIMSRNHDLALVARQRFLARFDMEAPCPSSMIGSMASVLLPKPKKNSVAARLDAKALCEWLRARGVRVWTTDDPATILRMSAQVYNSVEQFNTLIDLVAEAFG